MRVLSFITLSSIAKAWPRPDDDLESFTDPESIFDINSWPATFEDAIALSDPAECPVDGNPDTPTDSDTTEGDQPGSPNNYLLDNNLFSEPQQMTEYRTAPPCGPDGSHYLLCCLEQWVAPGILSSCRAGTCD